MQILSDIGDTLGAAIFLTIVANRLVAGLIKPLWKRFKLDSFWLLYVSWLVAGLLVWVSGVNLFGRWIPSPLIGQVLTALVAGGGANFLHDIFQKQDPEVIFEMAAGPEVDDNPVAGPEPH